MRPLARTLAAALAAFALLPALRAQEALFRPRNVTLEPGPVRLEAHPEAGLLTVRATLNGKPCTLLVDTGASHTTFDRAFLTREHPDLIQQPISLHGDTNVQAELAVCLVSSLKVGGNAFEGFYGVSAPLGHLKETLGQEVAGILGMNVLGRMPFRLSRRDGLLAWFRRAPAPKGAVRLPLAADEGDNCFRVLARAEGRETPIPMLVDAGANVTVLNPGQWPTTGEATAMETADVNAAGRSLTFAQGRKGTLRLGELAVEVTPVVRGDMPALLGADTLGKFDLVVDGPARAAWAVPHAKPAAKVAAPTAKEAAPAAKKDAAPAEAAP